VWYASIDSQFGRICFAATETGLVNVSIGPSERAFAAQLRAHLGVEPVHAPARLAAIGRQLREYLHGKRLSFDLPLDLSAVPEFQRQVLLKALEIPRGQVATYGDIARRIGHPKASRAVGQALGSNPIPLVIPCHRVIGSDGKLRGYGTGRGVQTKAQLLRWEGAGAFGD
jgi:methylated-DNA-[protein]-cysteine S-methyltransferase